MAYENTQWIKHTKAFFYQPRLDVLALIFYFFWYIFRRTAVVKGERSNGMERLQFQLKKMLLNVG